MADKTTDEARRHIAKKQRHTEMYGMGDIRIGRTITGRYPNEPEMQNLPGTPAHALEMARARGKLK